MKAQLAPITPADVDAVAGFLHTELNARVPAEMWAKAMIPPWKAGAPNHGYLLRADGEIVGAYLAFYSQREIDGKLEDFCNLGAWCVRPPYRLQSIRLLQALLAQNGYNFTDLSPSGAVVPLNTRLKFQFLDTTTSLVPNLPWPTWPGRMVLSSRPEVIEDALTGRDLAIFRDHADAAAARHLVIKHRGESCYVLFRKVRRKQLPLFVSLLHVGNPVLFRRAIRPVARHMLLRHGALVSLAEHKVVAYPPRWAITLSTARPKMYRSDDLTPEQIDNLYSELVCVPW